MTTPNPKSRNVDEEVRQRQCPSRTAGTCSRINSTLGWTHGMLLSECDLCWEKNPDSEHAQDWRNWYVRSLLGNINARGLEKYPLATVSAILLRHTGIRTASEILRTQAALFGRGIVPTALTIGGQPLAQQVKAATKDVPSKGSSPALRWAHVVPTWDQARSYSRSLWSRLLYLLTGRRISRAVLRARHRSCFGGDGEQPCEALRRSDRDSSKHYCSECGCGDKPSALIEDKILAYPHLECPRRRPGFSNEERT